MAIFFFAYKKIEGFAYIYRCEDDRVSNKVKIAYAELIEGLPRNT
ncbi:hypothetical protein [Aquibacillus koreensis]|nr:hypothetical protein [Aquibacillus koreensis]